MALTTDDLKKIKNILLLIPIQPLLDTLKLSYEVGDLSVDELIKLQELRKEILKRVN